MVVFYHFRRKYQFHKTPIECKWIIKTLYYGILRDKTMDDKLIHIPNNEKKNYYVDLKTFKI